VHKLLSGIQSALESQSLLAPGVDANEGRSSSLANLNRNNHAVKKLMKYDNSDLEHLSETNAAPQ